MSNNENTPIESIDVKPELSLVPSALSEAADTTAPTVHAEDNFEGASYRDFDHFSTVFGAYQKRTQTVYKVDGSATLKDAKNPDLVEKYKYDYAVFKCQHFGQSRHRGTGKRNHTNTLKLGCLSKLRLKLNRTTMLMEVTVWAPEHNHVCAPPQYDAKNRRILPEVIPYTSEVLAPKTAKSNRPTPYSRPARAPLAAVNTSLPMPSALNAVSEAGNNTLPIVSTEPLPSLERLSQELFKFMNPESEAERTQRLRNQMMAQIKFLHDSIPQHDTQKRNEVAMQLMPILKIFLNPPTVPALEQTANGMSKQ